MMRSTAALVSLHAIVMLAAAAPAATPGQINYQGLLLDQQGAPITGNVNLVFTIFDAAQNGTALWTETHPNVAALDGVYDVVLGATTPITPAVVADGSLYLQIAVNGETLVPRQRLVAVPYALRAAEADNLGTVDAGYLEQILQHTNFDGQAPPNQDPSEGLADPDGDGRANFIDSDNDGDGLGDQLEIAQGTNINLITPTIADIQPEPIEGSLSTVVTVTGTNFEPGITVSFGSQNPTPQNVTAISFQVAVGPQTAGTKTVQVTRTNGQSASTTFQFVNVQPVISSFDPAFLPTTGGTVTIHGSSFQAGIAVTFGSENPTPQNVTATSLQVTVGPHAPGTVNVTVYYPGPGGGSATTTYSFADTSANNKRMFVTSTIYNGNLGGIAGANAKCTARANAASFSGVWLAWIGDATGSPNSNFPNSPPPVYYLIDGTTLVAGSYTDLTDGSIGHVIDRDEFGASRFDYVWTNVNPNGSAGANSCQNWSSSSSSQGGGVGLTNQTDGKWTATGGLTCNESRRLYCVEQ